MVCLIVNNNQHAKDVHKTNKTFQTIKRFLIQTVWKIFLKTLKIIVTEYKFRTSRADKKKCKVESFLLSMEDFFVRLFKIFQINFNGRVFIISFNSLMHENGFNFDL